MLCNGWLMENCWWSSVLWLCPLSGNIDYSMLFSHFRWSNKYLIVALQRGSASPVTDHEKTPGPPNKRNSSLSASACLDSKKTRKRRPLPDVSSKQTEKKRHSMAKWLDRNHPKTTRNHTASTYHQVESTDRDLRRYLQVMSKCSFFLYYIKTPGFHAPMSFHGFFGIHDSPSCWEANISLSDCGCKRNVKLKSKVFVRSLV